MAGGSAFDSGAAKMGTGGGRGGVLGGAFSLSTAESWLEAAAGSGPCSCSGLGAVGVSALGAAAALVSTGGLGNS